MDSIYDYLPGHGDILRLQCIQKTPGAGEKKRFRAPAQVVMAASQRPAQVKEQMV
jgi:hypothetical protein